MKHLLYIFIFLSFMSVANSQQSFKPLSQYVLDHDIQTDNGAMIYTLQRCSALLNSINAIVFDQDKVLADEYFTSSNKLGLFAATLHSKVKNIKIDVAEKEVADLIIAKSKLYLADMKDNYLKSGDYVSNSYIQKELLFCTSMANEFDKSLGQ